MKNSKRNASKTAIASTETTAIAVLNEQDAFDVIGDTLTEPDYTATAQRLASELIEVQTNGGVTADEQGEPAPTEPARNPNLAPKFTTLGTRDEMGFGSDTETSWLIAQIRTGSYTRPSLQAAFLTRFVPNAEPSEIKRKKTSFSVFFSDVKRPIGTYHASRNLAILADANGILSFNAENYETVKAAIAANILTELKGTTAKRQPKKYSEILAKHGLASA